VNVRPARLIADRAYDSNPLRARLARRGIEPIIPALANHPNAVEKTAQAAKGPERPAMGVMLTSRQKGR